MLMSDIFKVQKDGEVGIEVEQEFFKEFLIDDNLNDWKIVKDGSLRNFGLEFVTKEPLSRQRITPALKDLDKYLTKYSKLNDHESPRTSVHVHTNTLDMTPMEVWNQIILYWILDSCMVELCGIYRTTNLFCLRLRDGVGVLDWAKADLNSQDILFNMFNNEELRYSSQNLVSITKFKSIEYRAHGGNFTVEGVYDWVNALLSIKDAARTFTDPLDILTTYYEIGPDQFIDRVLSPAYATRVKALPDYKDKVTYNADLLINLVDGINWKKVITIKTKNSKDAMEMKDKHKLFNAPRGILRPNDEAL